MSYIRGFPPITNRHAVKLILGSMPGRESLRQQRYYAHPRNSFWPILTRLLDLGDVDYEERVMRLSNRGFAVWDVLKACFRSSGRDADIDNSTITTNDFSRFYLDHPSITHVFFNGAKAEAVYRRHVLPQLPTEQNEPNLQRLPSTSPAHAGMTVPAKLEAWRAILT